MDDDLNELQARPSEVRAFSQTRQPGFADCAPSGRVRLDALACWLQDIAYADVEDAGLAQTAVWVVRRTRIRVNRFPRFGERFALTTFCSGFGRMWAERRTDIVIDGGAGEDGDAGERADGDAGARADGGAGEGADGGAGERADGGAGERADGDAGERPDVQAVSLWVHLDAKSWRPSRLTEAEIWTYMGAGAPSRRVSSRLRHPVPDSLDGGVPWTFRATECDIADHINNAAYWLPLEEELLARPDPPQLDAEIEYRAPAQPGVKRVLRDGPWRWIVGDGEELHASLVLRDAVDSASDGGARGA